MGEPAPKLVPSAGQPRIDAPQTSIRKLAKGEVVFAEGENSKAMYLVKSGILRVYKKKGEAQIEIATIHSGELIGELAFLDGNPRSASAEALSPCELVEISGPTFAKVLQSAPEWLKTLLKTVVGRLRAASTRIRQLEAASSAIDYSDKDGKKNTQYAYLSTGDALKLSTAVLLAAGRGVKQTPNGPSVDVDKLTLYGHQVMSVALAKITSWLDILIQNGIIRMEGEGADTQYILASAENLESYIQYQYNENVAEPSKRHDLSVKGFLIMGLITKYLSHCKEDPNTGLGDVNLAQIRAEEEEKEGRAPFLLDEVNELVRLGYCTNLQMKSATEVTTSIRPKAFAKSFRMQRMVMTLAALNDQKRKGNR